MNRVILIAALLTLAGCALDPHHLDFDDAWYYNHTSPGSALPNSAWGLKCLQNDELQRCKEWTNKSDVCMNPEGLAAKHPLVDCASIKEDAVQ